MFTRTKVVAHRGAWKEFDLQENSILSLQKAIEIGCAASECDIWMTRDAYFVVHHDSDFLGYNINESDFIDLQRIGCKNGKQLPLLSDFIHVIKQQSDTKLLVELKLQDDVSKTQIETTVRQLAEFFIKDGYSTCVSFILFHLDAAVLLKNKLPEYKVSFLNGDLSPQKISTLGLNGIDYHFSIFKKSNYNISDYKNLALHVNSWTVNEESIFKDYTKQGIDWITTDYPFLFITKGY